MSASTVLRVSLRYLILIISLFSFGVAVKFWMWDKNLWFCLAAAILAVSALGLFFYIKRVQEPDPLLIWLSEHEREVRAGNATYEGRPLRPDTTLIRFEACTSIIFWTTRYASNAFIQGFGPIFRTGLGYSLLTLLTGWWGLPYGIFWTLQVVFKNAAGGTRMKVQDLLNEPQQQPPPQTATGS